MSLWAEHLGMFDPCFKEAGSLETVRTVNGIAEENWRRYTSPDFTELHGHLLRYPLLVRADGKVEPLPGYENFPDVGGKVIGAHTIKIPDQFTT